MIQKTIPVLLLLVLAPLSAMAADILKIEPQIAVQEVFTDNTNLSSSNKQYDFITTILPGIRISDVGPTAGLDIDYKLGMNFFAVQSENNYLSHELNANGVYNMNPDLSFRFREFFLRSNDPREQVYSRFIEKGILLISSDRSRSIYYRNVIEPAMDYRFGRENRFTLSGRDNVYRNDSPLGENSREDSINPSLALWLNQRNGIELEYGFLNGDFQFNPDLVGHMARGRYIYRTMPGRIFFADYIYLNRRFDSPGVNYEVHNPSIGTEYAFTPTFSGRVQAGVYKFEPVSRSEDTGSSGEVSFLQRLVSSSVSAGFRWGYFEDYFSPENLGFAKYYGLFGNMTHNVDSRTTLGLSASVQWADFVLNRNDRIILFGVSAGYVPLKWLSMTMEVSHRQNSSSLPGFDYSENRVMFRISLIYI